MESKWRRRGFQPVAAMQQASGAYSRRINILHRLVYQVLENERVVKVLRLWSHYE